MRGPVSSGAVVAFVFVYALLRWRWSEWAVSEWIEWSGNFVLFGDPGLGSGESRSSSQQIKDRNLVPSIVRECRDSGVPWIRKKEWVGAPWWAVAIRETEARRIEDRMLHLCPVLFTELTSKKSVYRRRPAALLR